MLQNLSVQEALRLGFVAMAGLVGGFGGRHSAAVDETGECFYLGGSGAGGGEERTKEGEGGQVSDKLERGC